ncbi:MAG: T9SS type A sorting domain-containing protein [Gemmatimonadota bacterium]|nr:MAG: T9SS type A sorting domain-containing protein [Gemmatimonadota bacterium]
MDRGKNVMLVSVVLTLLAFASIFAGQIEVLRPGRMLNQSDCDTLTWRTFDETSESLDFACVGDTMAVWFDPPAPCSLIAIRFFAKDMESQTLFDVWDGSRYDGHITTTDSTDSNGWIGNFENDQWISGPVLGHSPIGWNAEDTTHHYWGPFSLNITEDMHGTWYELPLAWHEPHGFRGEVDIGDDPFIVSIHSRATNYGGMAAEYEGTTPYHVFKYHSSGGCEEFPGPDGQHFGWYILSASVWVEAIVKYTRTTSVEEDVDLKTPDTFVLFQNYPNPFNPETTIEYTLPEPTRVKVEVYSILGQIVEVLVDSEMEAGLHKVQWNGEKVSSGVYFYRITADNFSASKRMVLMK